MKNVKKEASRVKKCKEVNSIKNLTENKILISNSLKEFILPIIKHFKLKKHFKGI